VETRCSIVSIERVVQTESLETRTSGLSAVHHSEVAEVTLETRSPVPFDLFSEIPNTGRIVLVDREDVAGGGILMSDLALSQAQGAPHAVASSSA
jgi:sulfate adenylyltransferase subunit 1 (EFTu-like GTPase family)